MRKKALVVDDIAIVRRLISRMLLKFDIDSCEVPDGQQALHVLRNQPEIEIAFVDWNMPVMTGIDLLRQIRHDPTMRKLKVVMVTGNSDMSSVVSALEEGVDEYIMLPLTNEAFEEKLALLGIRPSEDRS